MTNAAQRKLVLPHCRFCGREWSPPAYVSANLAFCNECKDDRLSIAQAGVSGVRFVQAPNGQRVMMPVRR